MTAHRWRNSAGHLIRVDGHHVLCEDCPPCHPCECPEWYPASWPANGLLEQYAVSMELAFFRTPDANSPNGPWYVTDVYSYVQNGSVPILEADQNNMCEWSCQAQEYYTSYNQDGSVCYGPTYVRDKTLRIYYNGSVWGVLGGVIKDCPANIAITSNDCHARPPIAISGMFTYNWPDVRLWPAGEGCDWPSGYAYEKHIVSVSVY